MQEIDVFIKRGGACDVEHRRLDPNTTVAELKSLLDEDEDILFFDEDADDPLDLDHKLGCDGQRGRFVHKNRCKRVAVKVNYAGRCVDRKFGPGTTLARIQKWAERKLGVCETDGIELGLQIACSNEKPDPSTHVGSLVNCPECEIEFDLVPTDRINGAK